jgi:hypothetical protein
MMEFSKDGNTDFDKEFCASVLLAEYNSLRTEIVTLQESINQLVVAALVAVAGIATIVVALFESATELLISVLVILPVPFVILVLVYLGCYYTMANLSSYIREEISPRLNSLLSKEVGSFAFELLQWEKFHRRRYTGVEAWLGRGLLGVSQGLLIGFPVIGSFIALALVRVNTTVTPQIWWGPTLVFDVVLAFLAFILAFVALRKFELS